MLDDTKPGQAPADDLQLTSKECRLIRNFRAISIMAQDVLVDMSEEMTYRLPAVASKGNAAVRSA